MSLILHGFIFLVGICLGSFLNVVIYRLPRGASLARPGSTCPACRRPIAFYDNIPLVSYLVLRGRCRACGARISPRYFMVELICGLLAVAVFMSHGLGFRAVLLTYFSLTLVAITYIDLDEMVIPDALTLPAIVIGLAGAYFFPDWRIPGLKLGWALMDWGVNSTRLISLFGAVFGLFLGGGLVWLIYNLYFLLRHKEGIGGGDFTLLAMIGVYLGYRGVLVSIFLGSVLGLAGALALALRNRRLEAQAAVPFGPFLSIAALIHLFFGEAIIRWYLP